MLFRSLAVAAALSLSACSTYGAGGDALGYGTQLATNLSGQAEVPETGDANGAGEFIAALNPQGELCYELEVGAIGAPTGAHIHRGGAEENGPVVVSLSTPEIGERTEACAVVESELASAMLADPDGFYVNVHNEEFPGGAVRGQLMGAGM